MLACIAIAFLVDRRIERAREARRAATGAPGLHGGVVRVIFPVVALLLLGILRVALQDWPPFFVKIALPAFYALLAIRLLVYGLRRMFPDSRWLPSSERAIAFTIWAAVVLYFVGVLPEIESILDEVHLPLGKHQTSLLTVGKGLAVIAMTLVATLWVSGLLEQRLLALPTADMSMRVVLGKAVRAVMIVVGVLIALQAIGFDLTLLSVFGGALGVGIGLGLQKLASNYIAGFTILLDRSIRLGDMVTVDGRQGHVSKVTSRYVVVRSLDGVDAIVPNETLVTTTVLNHSYTSSDVRFGVPVTVAYDTDVAKALALMVEVARREQRVLPDAQGSGGVPGAVRRVGHRARARGLDQRPRERPAGAAQRPQPGHPGGIPRARDHDTVPAARSPGRQRRRARPGRRARRRETDAQALTCVMQSRPRKGGRGSIIKGLQQLAVRQAPSGPVPLHG